MRRHTVRSPRLSSRTFFSLAFLIWLVISILPFAAYGENAAYLWMSSNYPLSVAFEEIPALGIGYPYLYVAIVTLINGVAFSYCATLCFRIICRLRGSANQSQPTGAPE